MEIVSVAVGIAAYLGVTKAVFRLVGEDCRPYLIAAPRVDGPSGTAHGQAESDA